MKKMFFALMLVMTVSVSWAQDAQVDAQSEWSETEELSDFSGEMSYENRDHNDPDRWGWSFYGCFEHRRYCIRSANAAGYDRVRAELDQYCPRKRSWACFVSR